MDKLFGIRDREEVSKLHEVKLPVGAYEFEGEVPMHIELNGQSQGECRHLRFFCLDETAFYVFVPAGRIWQLEVYQESASVDGKPHEGLLLEPQPESQEDLIRRMLKQVIGPAEEEVESEEEANDFTLDDDSDLEPSQYELAEAFIEATEGMTKEKIQLLLDVTSGKVPLGVKQKETPDVQGEADPGEGDGPDEEAGEPAQSGSGVRGQESDFQHEGGSRGVREQSTPEASRLRGGGRGKVKK